MKSFAFAAFALVLLSATFIVSSVSGETLRPIIGVLAQPTGKTLGVYGNSYIAASYVKFIEGAGGRVAPIPYDMPRNQLASLFSQINGVLYPGGGAGLDGTPYFQTLNYIYNLALQANDKKDFFPVWGTCLGFEALCLLTSKDSKILSYTEATNISLPLTFTNDASKSTIFGDAPQDIINILSSQRVTLNNHHFGVTPSAFAANANLNNFYHALSTNLDKNGSAFVSSMEGRNYPVWGTQFHPEKPIYEWNASEDINHSFDSVRANQYFANFFVNQARASSHRFASPEAEAKALIYSYTPVYTYNISPDFEQCYFF